MPRSQLASLMMVVGEHNASARRPPEPPPPSSGSSIEDDDPTNPGRVSSHGDGYILVVEDDSDIRDVVVDVLEAEGYEVVAAADGREAFDFLHYDVIASQQAEIDAMLERYIEGRSRPQVRAHLPSLILLDLMLPVVNGQKLFEAIHSNPAFASVPIVIMSADHRISALRNDMVQIPNLDSRPNAVLAKPFSWEALIEKVLEIAGPPPSR